ncbi:MAG: VTT domain-containing protein [Candidatus Paceibacterota bacterium]|jgi:membrane protein DedA with SNARE-associated domain
MPIVQLLLTYKYLILIPLAIAEGPIVSVIAGFLATLGVFNIFVVYLIMVSGDIIGDAIFYYIGYSGKNLFRYFKINEEKIEKTKLYFEKNHNKAIAGSKILWGVGTAGLIAAGALHVPYKRYFKTCALYSLAQSFIMILLGIFFGQAYITIGKYFNYYASTVSIFAVAIIVYLIFIKIYKKNKEEI